MKNKATLTTEEIANAMGGGFDTSQVGDPGNLAGMPGIMGCPGPAVTRAADCWKKRLSSNKKSEENISKVVAILLRDLFPKHTLNEKADDKPNLLKTPAGKATIAGLDDNLALNLPPEKVIPPTPTKLPDGVNGLKLNSNNIANIYASLQDAAKKFTRANLEPNEIITNPNQIYKTRNAINSASTMNALTGIELGLFFRDSEDDDGSGTQTINSTVQKGRNGRFQKSLEKYLRSKIND